MRNSKMTLKALSLWSDSLISFHLLETTTVQTFFTLGSLTSLRSTLTFWLWVKMINKISRIFPSMDLIFINGDCSSVYSLPLILPRSLVISDIILELLTTVTRAGPSSDLHRENPFVSATVYSPEIYGGWVLNLFLTKKILSRTVS